MHACTQVVGTYDFAVAVNIAFTINFLELCAMQKRHQIQLTEFNQDQWTC